MGNRWINLYDLENKIIRGYGDARIHAALNCASKGCPMLSNRAYIPQRLDKLLGGAMTAMVNNPLHLQIDAEAKEVRASEIFKWYLQDFDATGIERLYAYWLQFISEEQRSKLDEAKSQNYPITWISYDWALNGPKLELRGREAYRASINSSEKRGTHDYTSIYPKYFKDAKVGDEVRIQGWVRTRRDSKAGILYPGPRRQLLRLDPSSGLQ